VLGCLSRVRDGGGVADGEYGGVADPLPAALAMF